MTFADVAATWGLPVNQSVSDNGLLWWHYSVPHESNATSRTFYVALVVFDNNGIVSNFNEIR